MSAFNAMSAASRTRLNPGPEKRRRARVSLVALIPLAIAAWTLAGYADVGFLDTFRLMTTNSIDGWDAGVGGIPSGMMLFFAGIFGGALLGFAVMWQSTSAFGTFTSGWSVSNAVGFGGAALGLFIAYLTGSWTEPEVVGRTVSDWAGNEDWGPGAWAAYHAPWALPAVFAVIAAVGLLRFARSHSSGHRAETKAAEIKEHGIHMPGTIDKVDFTNTWIMGNPQFLITVTYVGKHGPRQVSERVVTAAMDAPTRGGQVDVWYDPLGEDGVVVIELNEKSSSHMVNPGLFPHP